jgi:hypothetical protein
MFSEAEKMELMLIVTRHLEISDQRKKRRTGTTSLESGV